MIGLDTNILVYAFDKAYPKKREICKKIINDIFNGKKVGAVTNQILAEFASAVTKKIEKPLKKDDAIAIIGAIYFSENWKVFNYSGKTVLEALRLNKPFWDSLIIETLKENNVQEIVTENSKDFENNGLKVFNPLN